MLSNLVVIYDHSKKSSRPLFGASFQRLSRRRNGEVKVSIERSSHKSPWTPLLASQVLMVVELQQAKVGAFGRRLRPADVNLPLAQGTMPYGRRLLFKTLLRIIPGMSSMSRRHNLCKRLKQAQKDLKSRVPCRTDESDMVYAEELLKELIHVSNPFPPRPTTSATKTAAAAAKNEVSVACPALACPAGCAGCVGAS